MLNYIKAYSVSGKGPDGGLIADVLNDFRTLNKPFNVLILGGDKVNKNTDTIILVNFNPSTSLVSVLSIPRDTKVKIDGKYQKINYAYPHAGARLAVDTVKNLLDVDISYFVFVDTSSFKKIIDLLGGIDLYIPVDMDYDDPTQNLHIHFKKGQHHLNGQQAEEYIRFRHPNRYGDKEVMKYYDGSDLNRINAQQDFIKEFIKQKLSLYYLPKLNNLITTVFESIETNLSLNEALKMSGYLGKISSSNIKWFTLPGKAVEENLYYYIVNKDESANIINDNFQASGEFIDNINNSSIEVSPTPAP